MLIFIFTFPSMVFQIDPILYINFHNRVKILKEIDKMMQLKIQKTFRTSLIKFINLGPIEDGFISLRLKLRFPKNLNTIKLTDSSVIITCRSLKFPFSSKDTLVNSAIQSKTLYIHSNDLSPISSSPGNLNLGQKSPKIRAKTTKMVCEKCKSLNLASQYA